MYTHVVCSVCTTIAATTMLQRFVRVEEGATETDDCIAEVVRQTMVIHLAVMIAEL